MEKEDTYAVQSVSGADGISSALEGNVRQRHSQQSSRYHAVVNWRVMKRRDFLQAGALGVPLAPQPLAKNSPSYTGKPAMKITDIQTTLVGIESRNLCFVKVLTDQGITGWGEAYSVGPDEATVATIKDFKSWLVGKDPRNVEYLWATMYNFTRFPGGAVINAAISRIEHALWDIARKPAGVPVYLL